MTGLNKYLGLACILLAGSSYAASCLGKYKKQFDNRQVMLAYISDKPKQYFVGLPTDDESQLCISTYREIEQYLTTNYRKKSTTESGIITGWNYLAINNKVVYDFLATITPAKIKADNDELLANSDFKSYTADNQAEYRPVSLVNQEYGCYYHQQFSMTTGMAHPGVVNELICTQAGNPSNALKIQQIAAEQQIVRQLLQTKVLKSGLAKTKMNTAKISTYSQLSSALTNSNDDQLGCIAGTINGDNTGFSIDKLNSDGTIDITMGLNSDISACSSIYIPVTLRQIKPLMKITNVVDATKF